MLNRIKYKQNEINFTNKFGTEIKAICVWLILSLNDVTFKGKYIYQLGSRV